MRKTAVALAFALVTSLGVIVPTVAAATGDPKVVIIVGATGSATANYRADGDAAYAEAIKYTSNVVRVYSPDATWTKVKAAVVGASVVIYMGHGNGWPSPYPNDPLYTTKDGFGLNATAGAGDSNTSYYGEPAIATLDLAPGAIVLLHHLCYASGNSEPGNAEPTITVARQRADNYTAAFLKAGASAVIADGHAGAEGYLRGLFTTHQSIEHLWRTMPNENGNDVTFASVRTPGATVWQDPLTPTTGFYRSLVIGSLGVTTDEVVSGGYGDTSTAPATLVVPGNAAVTTPAANLYASADSTGAAAGTVPAGTRLRLVEQPALVSSVGAVPVVEVQGLDDPTITGFMAIADLAPKDSTAPIVRGLDTGGSFSPNADGQVDAATIAGRFTESVAWTLRVRAANADVLFERTGTGSSFSIPWNGLVAGLPVPDGTYTVALTGVDPWHNVAAPVTGSVTVDTHAPSLGAISPSADTALWFAPNGDGVRDSIALTGTNSEAGTLVGRALDGQGRVVRQWSVPSGTAPTAIAWDGRTDGGAYVADGLYTLRISARDAAGNSSATVDRSVTVIGALRSVVTSASIFFPNDSDALAQTTKLSFVLARPMTVTWTIRNAAGAIVQTRLTDSAQAAGGHYWTFDGRGSDGARLPRGTYTSSVAATDGTYLVAQAIPFVIDAFTVKPSDTTPGRGQSITVTSVSAEALGRTPTLWVYQPGVAAWSVRMTRVATNTYRATIWMRTSGRAGTVSLKVWGLDSAGGSQATTRTFALH